MRSRLSFRAGECAVFAPLCLCAVWWGLGCEEELICAETPIHWLPDDTARTAGTCQIIRAARQKKNPRQEGSGW